MIVIITIVVVVVVIVVLVVDVVVKVVVVVDAVRGCGERRYDPRDVRRRSFKR